MNNNITKYNLLTVILLMVISNFLFAQKREPQNIRRVIVTSQYLIEKGIRKGESWAINQEIFDSLGRMHTEIDYNWSDHYPHNYRWHTYKGMAKVRTETFQDEKLIKINDFTYNKDGLIIKNVVKKVSPGDTVIFLSINYTYNNQGKPITIDAKTVKGRRAYKSTIKYDLHGTEISRKVKVKKGYSPEDSIILLANQPSYDSIGRLISEKIIVKNILNKTIIKSFIYSYDKIGNLSGIKELNEVGQQIRREERLYKEKSNKLWQISYFNSNDQLVKFIAKRYELYKTNDRRKIELE